MVERNDIEQIRARISSRFLRLLINCMPLLLGIGAYYWFAEGTIPYGILAMLLLVPLRWREPPHPVRVAAILVLTLFGTLSGLFNHGLLGGSPALIIAMAFTVAFMVMVLSAMRMASS